MKCHMRAGVLPGLVLVLTLAGCGHRVSVPPVTAADAAVPHHGKFVWHDLLTEDVDAVKRFYGELLGWSYRKTEAPNYTLILHHGRPIGGIVDMAAVDPDKNESQWVSLLSVASVEEAVAKTRSAGGEVHVEPVELPGRGRLAVVSDPQGAVVAFLRAVDGDPPDVEAREGDWLWTELWTDDVEASAGFYGDLVGYDIDTALLPDDVEYQLFRRDGVPRAGVIPNPFDEVPANWLPYVRVEDPAGLAQRVEDLGGQVVLAPREDVRGGTVAIVIDPSGAAVALQKRLSS